MKKQSHKIGYDIFFVDVHTFLVNNAPSYFLWLIVHWHFFVVDNALTFVCVNISLMLYKFMSFNFYAVNNAQTVYVDNIAPRFI